MEYEKIITGLVQDTVAQIMPAIFEKFTFADIVSLTKESLDALGRGLLETVCKAVDDTYENNARKEFRLRIELNVVLF